MKSIFIFGILLTTSSVFAVDWTENTNRDIYDLMYLPNQGTFYGISGLTAGTVSLDTYTASNTKFSDTKGSSYTYSQEIGYSLTDSLAFSFSTDYLIKSTSKNEPVSGTNTNISSKGPGEPSGSVRYRVLGQQDRSINLDLIGKYTFSTGKEENDNNKDGGDSFELHAIGGKKFNDIQFSIDTSFSHENKSNAVSPTQGAGTNVTQQKNSYGILINFQRSMTETTRINIYGGVNVTDKYKTTDDNGDYVKFPNLTTTAIGADINFILSQNLLIKAGIFFASVADYTIKDQTGNSNKIKNTSIVGFPVSLTYQF